MDGTVGDCAQLFEAVTFLGHFKDLDDPRQRGKITYPLDEVLLLTLLAVLAGAETFVDIARFGMKKLDFLRRFRPFQDGTPAHDHLGDIFAVLDAEKFQHCFVAWVASLTGAPEGVIAIDGKTSRRSRQAKGAKDAIHMVSAFAARQRLVLGQVKVAGKSNEITAIPKLLDMLAIEGAVVTIDAMGVADQRFRQAEAWWNGQRRVSARDRAKGDRQKGRLRAGTQRQSKLATRRCRKVRCRAEDSRFRGYHDQPGHHG